jgi:hypothetical protein
MTLPRAALLVFASTATATFAYVLYQVLSVVQLTALQAIFLVLCTALLRLDRIGHQQRRDRVSRGPGGGAAEAAGPSRQATGE